jgi:drug/metabolite transporter (DMT)-like permease
LVVGSIVLLVFSELFEPRQAIAWNGGFIGILLFLAFAGTALSTWLWFWLLQRSEVGRLSLYLFLVPVFGLLLAMGRLGEHLDAWQGSGVALILMAVAVSVFAGWFGAAKENHARSAP